MPSFIVVGYFIDQYGYSFTWMSIILVSIIAVVGFYIMATRNNQASNVSAEQYSR
ncbi:hypothetical protein N9R79_04085 [Vibrio sp.]|nr:hypothetical protein [Vibrio sp.]